MTKKAVGKRAVLAFVPVIHKGYLDFFRANEGDIFIFGQKLIDEYVHLMRDIRTIDPNETKKALENLLPGRKVKAVEPKDLAKWPYDSTLMPEDEVSEDVAKRYLSGKKVEYASVFLRWNRIITFKEFEIPAGRKISRDEFDRKMIAAGFAEAKKSSDWWRQIASVLVRGKKVLAKAHNHHLPTDFHLAVNGDPRSNFDAGQHQEIFTSIHSEAALIAEAARKGLKTAGAELYVTTFPCPNCARIVAKAGIKRVYYAKGYSLLDAEKILDHFGVEVVLVES